MGPNFLYYQQEHGEKGRLTNHPQYLEYTVAGKCSANTRIEIEQNSRGVHKNNSLVIAKGVVSPAAC
jgi:hypothetical protein